MLVLFFAQGAKTYFAWVVFSRPLRNSFLISRHHAIIRRWCYGVVPWVDVSEIPWRLTEAELSVCVALGWSLYEIYSVQKFDQSRHLAKTKLHPEYPHRKKMNSALRPSFMGIVFGVYRIWIGEFGDLKSDTPILWGSIWPNTIISNPIFYFSLGSIVFGTQIRWSRGQSYLLFSI